MTGRSDANPFSASVMDYNPIYLAPAGAPQGDFFMQDLGAYDDLSVEYIYKPLEHLTEEERARELDRIASRAETEPGLVFDAGVLGDIDPTSNSDDYGDDPLAFAESRLRMIQEEVLPRLPELVLTEGHDYNLLRQALDSAIFSVAMDYVDMAARQVGGQGAAAPRRTRAPARSAPERRRSVRSPRTRSGARSRSSIDGCSPRAPSPSRPRRWRC